MAEYHLLPRLDNVGVRRLLAVPHLLRDATIADRMTYAAGSVTYAASGGSRAVSGELDQLRGGVIALARQCGFPDGGKATRKSSFDAECAAWLAEQVSIRGGEALRDDVWAFIASCIAPDVALWRFEDAHPDRFQGGLRNTFQRLWLRAMALDRGEQAHDRWQLVQALSEDAAVQIVERPSIGADPVIARAIAEAWVETAARIGTRRMEAVTRAAVRRIRIANEIICFGVLAEAELSKQFQHFFDQAADGIS